MPDVQISSVPPKVWEFVQILGTAPSPRTSQTPLFPNSVHLAARRDSKAVPKVDYQTCNQTAHCSSQRCRSGREFHSAAFHAGRRSFSWAPISPKGRLVIESSAQVHFPTRFSDRRTQLEPTIRIELSLPDWLELQQALGPNVTPKENESASAFGEPVSITAVVAVTAVGAFAAWLAKSRSFRLERINVTVQNRQWHREGSYASFVLVQ